MTELRVLGALEVRAQPSGEAPAGLTQPKRLAVLVYLALAEPVGLHSRDRLLALLWPEADENSARHSLRNALHALRQALGESAIVTRGEDWVGLDFNAVRCDALELRRHLAAGRVNEALALWAGDLAPGFHVSAAPEFERWLDEQRSELRDGVRKLAWARSRELKGAGQAEVDAARRAMRLDPGNEPGARQLMSLLAASGDRAGALRIWQDLADWFARELEAEPSAETRTLALELRSSDVAGPALPRTPAIIPGPTPAATPQQSRPATRRPMRRALRSAFAAGTIATGALVVVALAGESPFTRHARNASPPELEAERAVLRLPARYRADTTAYGSYLRGLTLRFEFRFLASRDTFRALVDRAPLFVPGLTGLAHALIFTALNDLTDPNEAWPKIDVLARRALALDSTAADAWLALASEDMFARSDLGRAAGEIARARELDSLDADVAGMQSVWFRFHARMDSAVAEARLAHRRDPLSLLFARLVGKQLFFARRYEESGRVFAQLLEDDPGWTRGYEDYAELLRAMNRPREAVTWLRRARVSAGDSAAAAALPDVATDAAARDLLAADARRTIGRLRRAARNGGRVLPSDYAAAWAALGDTTATLWWLDSMTTGHDSYLAQVRVDPVFDFLRGDPRYRAWEERSGLPPLPAELNGR